MREPKRLALGFVALIAVTTGTKIAAPTGGSAGGQALAWAHGVVAAVRSR